MRNHPDLGPIALATNIPILGQAYSAEDSNVAFLPGYTLCADNELSPVLEGGPFESRQQRREPN